ncbi:hypothetical protein RVIR1_07110 [Candidatus Rickettsiella viridis]|uniref:Uncharacterized protein n=1 Tax=Candidatus Rickettsiella viridis TaxID=676208 RepID=A0A2Z5UVW7_9COXI|nr:hypothetical protein RVIR1_07110 [Candidatus Rickettsiella viridis]
MARRSAKRSHLHSYMIHEDGELSGDAAKNSSAKSIAN